MKGALGTAELPGSIPLTQPVDRRPGSSSPFANAFNVLLGVALAACAVGTIFVVRSVRRRQAARNKGLFGLLKKNSPKARKDSQLEAEVGEPCHAM